MDLSIIIISYNTREITRRCLEALFAELEGLQAEVFVVDNASTDGSTEMIRGEFASVHLIANEKNRGFGAANNQAIALASAPAVLLLNSDAFVHAGAIRTMLEVMESRPKAGVIAPKLLNADGSIQPSVWPFPSPLRSWIEALGVSFAFNWTWHYRDWRRWTYDAVATVPWAIGACLLIRREVLAQVGGFDESFFLYGEETEWERRVHRVGWSIIFTPEARITHLGGASGLSATEQTRRLFFEGLDRYVLKHHGGVAGVIATRTAIVVGTLLRLPFFLLPTLFRHADPYARRKLQTLVWLLKRQLTTWIIPHSQ